MKRDASNVEFVNFDDCSAYNYAAITDEILAQVPTKMVNYFRKQGISPSKTEPHQHSLVDVTHVENTQQSFHLSHSVFHDAPDLNITKNKEDFFQHRKSSFVDKICSK